MHDCVVIPCCQVIYSNRGVKNYKKEKKKEKPGTYRTRVRRQGQKSEIILFTVWG